MFKFIMLILWVVFFAAGIYLLRDIDLTQVVGAALLVCAAIFGIAFNES